MPFFSVVADVMNVKFLAGALLPEDTSLKL